MWSKHDERDKSSHQFNHKQTFFILFIWKVISVKQRTNTQQQHLNHITWTLHRSNALIGWCCVDLWTVKQWPLCGRAVVGLIPSFILHSIWRFYRRNMRERGDGSDVPTMHLATHHVSSVLPRLIGSWEPVVLPSMLYCHQARTGRSILQEHCLGFWKGGNKTRVL